MAWHLATVMILMTACLVTLIAGQGQMLYKDESSWEECVPHGQDCMREYSTACMKLGREHGYQGTKNTTISGRTCMKWTAQAPWPNALVEMGEVSDEDENYCRNPDARPGKSDYFSAGPWCFTTDPSRRWEYCFDDCEPNECVRTNWIGTDDCARLWTKECRSVTAYGGKRFVTASGRTCQPWGAQYPHPHKYGYLQDAGNACRNPNGEREGPWCYTTDPNVEWELCFNDCKDTHPGTILPKQDGNIMTFPPWAPGHFTRPTVPYQLMPDGSAPSGHAGHVPSEYQHFHGGQSYIPRPHERLRGPSEPNENDRRDPEALSRKPRRRQPLIGNRRPIFGRPNRTTQKPAQMMSFGRIRGCPQNETQAACRDGCDQRCDQEPRPNCRPSVCMNIGQNGAGPVCQCMIGYGRTRRGNCVLYNDWECEAERQQQGGHGGDGFVSGVTGADQGVEDGGDGFVSGVSNNDNNNDNLGYPGDRAEALKNLRCGPNEKPDNCGNVCDATCDNYATKRGCYAICEWPSCACADGYVRDGRGVCVHVSQCPSSSPDYYPNPEEPVVIVGQNCGQLDDANVEHCPFWVQNSPGDCNRPESWIGLHCLQSCCAVLGRGLPQPERTTTTIAPLPPQQRTTPFWRHQWHQFVTTQAPPPAPDNFETKCSVLVDADPECPYFVEAGDCFHGWESTNCPLSCCQMYPDGYGRREGPPNPFIKKSVPQQPPPRAATNRRHQVGGVENDDNINEYEPYPIVERIPIILQPVEENNRRNRARQPASPVTPQPKIPSHEVPFADDNETADCYGKLDLDFTCPAYLQRSRPTEACAVGSWSARNCQLSCCNLRRLQHS